MQFMAQRIPRAAYRCIAEMGHLAHMEAPQRVNPVLIDFLQTHL
jgi:pimeloyl-ACP methyl ester carboxylesterase